MSDVVGPSIPGLQFVRHLGSGGFGDVHLYRDTNLNRDIAVKVIREADPTGELARTLAAEANAMAGLTHPHIVRVYGTSTTDDGRPYIAMEYYEGGTMESRAVGGRLPLSDVLRTGIEIGGAIESAHRARILHRDIKPANILVTAWGATGLTDFGVAAEMSAERPDEDVGVSVPWSPAEMLYSDSEGSFASDIYSLAATLWHLLVGRAPFELPLGDNSRFAMMARVRSMPTPVTGRADCPAQVESLLQQAMHKDPAMRPRTAADFVRGLEAAEAQLQLPRTRAIFLGGQRGPGQIEDVPSGTSDEGFAAGTKVRPRRHPVESPPAGSALDHDAHGSRTRRRAAQSVVLPGREPRADPDALATERRSRVSEVSMERAPDPSPAGRTKALLIGGVGLAFAGAAVTAWLLLAGDGSAVPAPRDTVAAQATAVDPLVAPVGPPGPVHVTVSRRNGAVAFAWTYVAALTTDQYRVRIGNGATVAAKDPKLSVPAPKSGTVCIAVQVIRADGSDPTREWPSPTCG